MKTTPSNQVLTTRELAQYIRLNEKTVIKMAQKGRLPGVKIGNQWRFHLNAIDAYLQNDLIQSSDEELDMVIKTTDNIIPLSRLTDHNLLILDLKENTADAALSSLAETAYSNGLTPSKENLLKELKKREKMLSTAMGDGVAIPHPRHPSAELFQKPNVVMLRSKNGVAFKAPDDKPVHLFFMTCAPDEFAHVRLLAKISRLLHSPGIIKKFIRAKDKDQIIQILLEFERENMFPEKAQ